MNTSSLNFSSIATLMTANREAQSTIAYDRNQTMTWESFQHNIASLRATLEALDAQRIALCFGNSYLLRSVSLLVVMLENPSSFPAITNLKL